LHGYNITPPVRTEKCDGEELSKKFQEGSFDIVYSSNAIDHMYNPLRCITEMVWVVTKGGHIILRFNEMAAEFNRNAGLHQWNFFTRKPRLLFGGKHLYMQGASQRSLDVTIFFGHLLRQVYTDYHQRCATVVFRKI